MDPENRAAINLDGVSVWLDVPLEEVLARLPADGRRPLAADRAQMERLFASGRRPTPTPASASMPAAPARRSRGAHHRGTRIGTPLHGLRRQQPLRSTAGLNMRYLILSDIHANIDALEAVLDAAPADSWDRVLVLGDLVGYGAEPNARHRPRPRARPDCGDPRQSRQGGLRDRRRQLVQL